MVTGLETFKKYFAPYRDCYVLIGGSACDVYFENQALPFRVTRDLDMILCVEALTSDFFKLFWNFIRDGGYVNRQKASGEKQFYRFTHPTQPGFPMMLELFSRRADFLPENADTHLTPIPAGEEASSLSAILLDGNYYDFVMANRHETDGVTILNPIGLIVLKALAWLDLTAKKDAGDADVHARDIAKHRNDIVRIASTIDIRDYNLPDPVKSEMRIFLDKYKQIDVDVKSLGIAFSFSDIQNVLAICFGLSNHPFIQ